jgi:hypothetical protein
MLEHKLGTELGRMEREINRSEASEPIDRLERTA